MATVVMLSTLMTDSCWLYVLPLVTIPAMLFLTVRLMSGRGVRTSWRLCIWLCRCLAVRLTRSLLTLRMAKLSRPSGLTNLTVG